MDNLNRRLQKEVVERRRIEKALREANDELDRRVADRTAALAESEERFSQLAEKIHQAFYVATLPDRQSLYLSPGFEAIWGIPVERAYQRPEFFVESVFEEDRGIVASALEQENLGIATETEYRIVRADGDVRWIHDQAFPLKNEAGEVYRVVGTSEDITEQKMLAEQLLQSQKMNAVGKLAGGVAHDFNNLLTVINGYSKLGLRKLGEEDPMRINLEEIRKAGERAQGLTSQLLAFSRKQMLKPEVLNLNKLYVNFEKMLRRLIGEDIDLSATLRAQGQIKADPVQLEQVLINLVVNARDAMQLGGVLTIETGDVVLDQADAQRYDVPAGRYVCLSVKDTGIGMDQETRTRMFEPFFTTKEQDKGTGLGLSTVYGIVSQSGGVIQVDSQVNKGTAFHIYFPWHRDDSTVDQRESHQEDIVKGFGRVLVAEDEDMVRLLTVTVLQESGYQVLEARNAKDAIQLFEAYQGEIDLLVTDVVMPQMSGKELADHLCSLQPKLRILYISGYLDDVKDKHEILESQVAFLQKPFMPGELSTKVRDVLDDPIS